MEETLRIIPISESNVQIFEVFEQDYEAEFSAITEKEPDGEGLFAVETDWKSPNRGFYLFIGEKPAGFAICGKIEEGWDVGEFYILPCYRKKGYGRVLAFAIFDLLPGPWQIRQIYKATGAIDFWRSIIHEYTNGNYVEDQVPDPHWGVVVRQRFTSSKEGP